MVTSRAAAAQNVQAVQGGGGGGMGGCHQRRQSPAEGSWGCLCIQPVPGQLLLGGAYYRYTLSRLPQAELIMYLEKKREEKKEV